MGASCGTTSARAHKLLLRIRPLLNRLKWGGQRDWLGFAQASYAGAAAPPVFALRAPSNFVLVPLRMGRPTGLEPILAAEAKSRVNADLVDG